MAYYSGRKFMGLRATPLTDEDMVDSLREAGIRELGGVRPTLDQPPARPRRKARIFEKVARYNLAHPSGPHWEVPVKIGVDKAPVSA